MYKKIQLLDNDTILTKIKRMALEIWEKNAQEKEIFLVGIEKGGKTLATYLKEILDEISDLNTQLIPLEINKTDFTDQPDVSNLVSLKDKGVVLIDDVANSGKTLSYAMIYILQHFPKKLMIAVLIDRLHKSYPLKADVVGHEISTTIQDHIMVEFEEDKIINVYLE